MILGYTPESVAGQALQREEREWMNITDVL